MEQKTIIWRIVYTWASPSSSDQLQNYILWRQRFPYRNTGITNYRTVPKYQNADVVRLITEKSKFIKIDPKFSNFSSKNCLRVILECVLYTAKYGRSVILYLEDYLMYEHHPWGLWVSMTRRLTSKCMSLWPLFHGPQILPYFSKTIWWMNVIFLDNETVWHNFDLKINIGQNDLYFML